MTATPQDVQAKLAQAAILINEASNEAGQLVAPPPPPSGFGVWAWDVQSLAVDPNSAALVASMLATTPHGWASASQAVAVRTSTTTCYAVTGLGHGLDPTVEVPDGTQAGLTSDHHLLIVDEVTGRTHDMWEAKFDTNGHLVSCSGGISYDTLPVRAYTPQGGSANASDVPSQPSALTPADVKAGVASRTLRFGCHLPGPGPVRYPAAPWASPYTNGTAGNPPLGTLFRLPQTAVLPSTAAPLERCIFNTLKLHGAVLTDGGSSLTFRAVDQGGGGQGAQAWANVGVTMVTSGGAISGLKCGTVYQMTLIPWAQLEAVVPPAG